VMKGAMCCGYDIGVGFIISFKVLLFEKVL